MQGIEERLVQSWGWEDPLEEGMATHSSILAWRIPTDGGAWWATVHRIVKRTQLSNLALMWDSDQEIMLRARATNLLNGSVYRSWCGPTEEVCVDLGDTGEP